MGSSWWYGQEIDELKYMIPQTILQLKTPTKDANAIDDERSNGENRRDFLNFLAREREYEARDQLQNLGNKLMPYIPTKTSLVLPSFQQESPNLTTCGTISEIYDNLSYGSSPVDSVLDMVSSPELPYTNACIFGLQYDANEENSYYSNSMILETQFAAIVDSFVKGKALPKQGKLLQAVMEAGPLLKTLVHPGSLPRWRNPPPCQSFQISPFPFVCCDHIETFNPSLVSNYVHSSLSLPLPEISNGSYKLCSKSSSGGSRTRRNKEKGSSSGASEPSGKLQRQK